eukprot:Lithocolla_globosa_v1_NODE_722_length_3383_cov_12.786959.p3 type:complete len:163 gc:universal NODE_722_length_3383_cov_12.786959:693-1181(+)
MGSRLFMFYPFDWFFFLSISLFLLFFSLFSLFSLLIVVFLIILLQLDYLCCCSLFSDFKLILVFLFFSVLGEFPFFHEEEEEGEGREEKRDPEHYVSLKIQKGEFFFPQENEISEQGKDFIRKCLNVQPKKRFDIINALKHSWLSESESESEPSPSPSFSSC